MTIAQSLAAIRSPRMRRRVVALTSCILAAWVGIIVGVVIGSGDVFAVSALALIGCMYVARIEGRRTR